MQCPSCSSRCVRRSKRRAIVERTILSALCVRPFRCVECGVRFFRLSLRKNVPLGQTGVPNRSESQTAEAKPGLGGEAARLHLNLS